MAQKVYLKKSAVVDKTPSASNLEFGELAINYASGSGKSFLATEKYDGSIAKFHEDTYNEAKYASKTDYESYTATTDSAIATAKNTAVSAFTYASAISATVKSTYWTSATTKSKIDDAVTSAATCATTYANNTFLTVSSATSKFTNIDSDISALSGGVVSEYLLKTAYVASGTTKGRWEVTIPGITEYYDGLTIMVRLGSSYNGTSNLLNVNGLGNAFVFYRRSTIATSHLPQWAEVRLVYRTDATTGYTSTFNYSPDIVSGTVYTAGWVCDFAYNSDTNTALAAGYERRYAGNRLTRYQIVAVDKDERLQPLTRVDSGNYSTGTTKPVNTVAIRPERFFYRSTTAITAANAVEGTSLYEGVTFSTARYTFNSDIPAYRAVYLRGSYNPDTDLFTLNTGLTSFYTMVPTNAANITLSDYFVAGDYYIYLCVSNSSDNNLQLTPVHELFYFDGTNLVKYSKKYTDDKVAGATSDVSTLSGQVVTIKNNYASHTEVANASARTFNSAYTAAVASAKTYTDNQLEGLNIGQYATTGDLSTTNANISALEEKLSTVSATVKSAYWTSATTKSKIDEAKNAAVTSAYNASVASAKAYTDGLADFVKTYSSTTDSTLATLKSSATTLSGWVTDLYSKVGNYATHDEVKNASGNAITSAVSKAITSAKSYVDTNFVDKTTYTGYTAATNSSIATAQGTADAISATVRSRYWTSAETKTKIDAAVTSAYNASTAYTYGQIEALNLGQYATSAQLATTNSNLSTLSGEVVTIKGNYATKSFVGSASGYAYTQAKSDVIGQSTDNKDANTIYGAKAYASSLTKTLSGNVVSYVDGKVTTINSDISAVKTSAFTLSASVISLSGAVNTKLSSVFKYKGTVASCSNLPNNAETGDTYNVVAASGNTPAGTNWTWSGEGWDPLAGTVDLSGYVTVETYNGYTGATNSTLSDHGNKIEKLNTNSGSMQNQITQLTTNSGSMQNQITKLSSNSGVMQNQINKLADNSGSMYTMLTGATGNITTLQSATGDLTNKVTQLTTNSGSLQNQITKLSSNSGVMQNQIAKLEANSGSLQNQVTKLAENSASMYTTLTGATGDITTLKSNTATMNTTLTKVNSSYVSAVTISTTGTAATIASNTLKIPVVNNNAALAFGSSKTIATIGGVNITASLPEGGYQGPQGPTGAQGPKGQNGNDATGVQGPQGPTGAQGNKGDQGPQGTKGDQGPQGPTGAQGPKGQNGNDATGVQGPQGPNGTNGAQGRQGIQGPQGPKGTDGTNGTNGTDGKQGPQGPKGETGGNGTNGKQGPQGPIGEVGYYIKQTAELTDKTSNVWTGTTGQNSGVGKTVIQTFSSGHGLRVNDYFTLYGTDYTYGDGHLNIVRVTATAATKVTGTTVSAVVAYGGTNGSQGPQGPKGSDGTNATGVQGPQGPTGAQGPAAEGSSLALTSTTGNTAHYLIGCTATTTNSTQLTESNTHRAGAATGAGIYWYGVNLYASSDERLKDFYDDVNVNFDDLKRIPKKYFKWKADGDDGEMNIGTSAQKLKEFYPELVTGEDNGMLGVSYEKLSVVALAAVDKLHEENVALKKEVDKLKSRIDKIEGQHET